jgi:hypothetical protein
VRTRLPLVTTWGIRDERDPTIYELLNGDVGNLYDCLNFENKSYVFLYFLQFNFRCILVFFVLLSSRPRVT